MLRPGFFLLFAGAALTGAAADKFDVKANYQKFEYDVPMRDGVKLRTEVYVPRDSSARYPILLTRTPYSSAPYGPDAYREHLGPSTKFAEDKFVFVYQDARGRFMSEGEFIDMPPIKDKLEGPTDTDQTTDTYDTIEWLLRHVPNNGKVGMLGTSYPGFYTSCGLIRAHPALLAASPQAPMADLYMGDDAYHNGAFFLIANFSFYTDFNKQSNPVLPPEKEAKFDYGTTDGYKFYLQMGALENSEKLMKNPYWTDMYVHTNLDGFWKPRNILPHLSAIGPAVLVVGGWYDAEDLSGTLKTFRAIAQQSPGTTDRLVMGPWRHGGWNSGPGDKLGSISFGANTGEYFRDEIELPFFRHYLKDAPDPALPKALVFETGKNEWKKLPQWPPVGRLQRLYFQAQNKLSFQPPAEDAGADEYISDPHDPVPFHEKPTLTMSVDYMDADQRFVEGRKDVVTYMTDPLTEDMTIAGPVSPTLYVSTSGTDSDFDVKLIDVYPADVNQADDHGQLAGYRQLVRGEPFRGKFRNSFEHPEPFTPGVVQQINFTMPDVYHCFLKGHRVMVQIQSSWFPLTDVNPQTFIDIPHAKPEEFVKATERIYRGGSNASFVEVNIEQR